MFVARCRSWFDHLLGSGIRDCVSISAILGDVVAQWLERRFETLIGQVRLPTLPVSFGLETISRWSLPSGIYSRGSNRFHTGGKCVTCRELNILA